MMLRDGWVGGDKWDVGELQTIGINGIQDILAIYRIWDTQTPPLPKWALAASHPHACSSF